jgi:hypothetical protein
MRGARRLDLWAVVLLGLCGCVTSDNQIKPPETPEQYRSPPAYDGRYAGPPKFPKETLNQDMIRRPDTDGGVGGPGGPGGMGRNGPTGPTVPQSGASPRPSY